LKREKKFSISRFIFELFIVFIGVYGAFELNRYQQNQREHKIRENYFISFKSELEQLITDIQKASETVEAELQRLATYDDSLGNHAFNATFISFRQALLITQAGFNDDIFVQLDPSLASSLIGGYDYVKSIEKMVDVFNETSSLKMSGILYKELYTKSGELNPEFSWYESKLKVLQSNFKQIGTMMQNGAMPAVESIINNF